MMMMTAAFYCKQEVITEVQQYNSRTIGLI